MDEISSPSHPLLARTRVRAGAPRSRWRLAPRVRFAVAVTVLLGLVTAAAVLPVLAGYDNGLVDYDAIRDAPTASRPFGTDDVGRSLLPRTFAGLRISLLVAASCAIISTLLGTLVGACCGLLGSWVDRLVMRGVDTLNAVPNLLLGVVIVALYRGSVTAVVASVALTHWTTVARIVRSEVLSLRERAFLDAAVLAGASRWWLLRQHLLPAVFPQAALSAVLLLPHAVWHETALSFLGLGMPPHAASIGNILADGRDSVLLGAWWTLVFPTGVLVATTLAVSGIAAFYRDRIGAFRRRETVL